MQTEIQRGVGWCRNLDCSERLKLVLLLGPLANGDYFCPMCRQPGGRQDETYDGLGEEWYASVRVEFNFDSGVEKFLEAVIVYLDDALGPQVTLRSPLVKTETRATKIAQALLANLNTHGHARTTEFNMFFDRPIAEWREQCAALGAIIDRANARTRGLI
jgi:hypothetical protein